MAVNIEKIIVVLREHLTEDAVFKIIDESVMHQGHEGYNADGGLSHVYLEILWDGFKDMPLLERHRLVNSWLNDFLKNGLHAARYRLKTLDENMPL